MTASCRPRSQRRASLDPAEIGGAKCAVSFSRLLRREVFRQARRDVLGAPIDADALCQPRQRAAQQGVAFDVDLFTAGETPFEILGQNTGRAEPSDQLSTRFRPGRPRWRQRYRENAERCEDDHQCRARSSSHSSACRGHNPSAPLSRREPTASPGPNSALPRRNRRSAEWYLGHP